MSVQLSIDDLFEMAIQVEKDARAFFLAASELYADPAGRQLMLDLATLEGEHEQIFDVLRDAHTPAGRRTPVALDASDNPALLSAAVFVQGVRDDLAAQFTGRETPHEIVRRAIQFEKDTIVFLVDMKQRLAARPDAARIDTIIREELGHIVKLVGHLGET